MQWADKMSHAKEFSRKVSRRQKEQNNLVQNFVNTSSWRLCR